MTLEHLQKNVVIDQAAEYGEQQMAAKEVETLLECPMSRTFKSGWESKGGKEVNNTSILTWRMTFERGIPNVHGSTKLPSNKSLSNSHIDIEFNDSELQGEAISSRSNKTLRMETQPDIYCACLMVPQESVA